jgi:hypothetical protein
MQPAHGQGPAFEVTALLIGAGLRYRGASTTLQPRPCPVIADWWVAGGAAASAEDADVELDEVEQFYTERDLWNTLV